jgi:hypothetical protein
MGDVTFDFGVEGPLVLSGNVIGAGLGATLGAAIAAPAAIAGTAAATPAGGFVAGSIPIAVGGTAGAMVGGASGKIAAEAIKKGIGDFFLDSNVPPDLEETTYQALLAGGFSVLGKGIDGLRRSWGKMGAESTQKFLKELAVRESNGQLDTKIVGRMAADPENYTPEAVAGSGKKLSEISDRIWGTSVENPKSTRDLTGGVARETINPLNKRADLEIDKLALNPEANFSIADIIGTLQDRTESIAQKEFPGRDGEKTLEWLNSKITKLKDKTRQVDDVGKTLGYRDLNFKETREFLKNEIQNDVYSTSSPVYLNPTATNVSRGLKELTDVQAGKLGSDLPDINAKRSQILELYKTMRQTLSPRQMESAFLGGDRNLARNRAREVFGQVDQVLGTDLKNELETTQGQSLLEEIYNQPKNFGSGSKIKDAATRGVKKAAMGGTKGFGLGVAASPLVPGVSATQLGGAFGTIGAARGLRQGIKEGLALSTPQGLVEGLSAAKTSLRTLNRDPTSLEISLAPWKQLGAKAATIATTQAPLLPSPQPAPQAAASPAGPLPGAQGLQNPAAPAQTQTPSPVELPPEIRDLKLTLPPP